MTSWIFCLADSSYYKLPFFNPTDLFFSPDIEKEQTNTFRIPSTNFNIHDFIRSNHRLKGCRPDFVFIKTDATRRNLISGLSDLGCPSFVSIADTHHLYRPLETMIEYISRENFTYISAENDRHHLKWYARAGFKNLCWIPNVALFPQIIAPQKERLKKQEIVFVGSLGKFHPYRTMVVNSIKSHFKDRFKFGNADQTQASQIYNSSLISINVSLNSDLNWRFFEIIAAGGFLLTDRLPKESGIDRFFKEGVHYDAFSSEDELLRKINFYLTNPEIAMQIAQRAHSQYIKMLNPNKLRSEVIKIVFDMKQSDFSRYETTPKNESSFEGLRAYQSLQELHRNSSQVIIMHKNKHHLNSLIEDLQDFPRIKCIDIEKEDNCTLIAQVNSYSFSNKNLGVILIDSEEELNDFGSLIQHSGAIIKMNGEYMQDGINSGNRFTFKYEHRNDCYIKCT